jgi:alkylation response protein AidB-like acyl-CoA dehydrogenase
MNNSTHQLKQYWVAEALERDLGDPNNPESVLSFKRAVELDEREEFPEAELSWLYNWKLQHYYVPANCGGEFTSFEEFIAFVRVMSRRDLTTGISFTTLFWSFLTWMAGTDEQKQRLANYIKNQNGAMCLAYSEREHGSDLVASDLRATKVPGGYLLKGEKWPINRAYDLWSLLCASQDRRWGWWSQFISIHGREKPTRPGFLL